MARLHAMGAVRPLVPRPVDPPSPTLVSTATAPPATLEDVLSAYGPALWRLAGGHARDAAARADLHQEILVALWRALPSFRHESSLATFVFRVATNRALTHRARAATRRAREMPLDEALDAAAPAPTPDVATERALEHERLREAILALPLTLAQPVLLHLEGLTAREIGEVLGVAEGTVAVRLHRARAALRRALAPTERSTPPVTGASR